MDLTVFNLIGMMAEYHPKAADLSIQMSKEINKELEDKEYQSKFYDYLEESNKLKKEYDILKWIYNLFY